MTIKTTEPIYGYIITTIAIEQGDSIDSLELPDGAVPFIAEGSNLIPYTSHGGFMEALRNGEGANEEFGTIIAGYLVDEWTRPVQMTENFIVQLGGLLKQAGLSVSF